MRVNLSANTNNTACNVSIAARIFAEHWDFIYGVILCKVRDKSRADDLFQDFFLSLISRPPSPDINNIKGYLYRAVTNDIIDSTRRAERYQRRVHRYAKRLKYTIVENGPENALIEAEEINKMFRCIEKHLQRNEAEAIILRYRNHYKIKEIAAAMDVNNTVAWRYISKGLRKIGHFLKKGSYNDCSIL